MYSPPNEILDCSSTDWWNLSANWRLDEEGWEMMFVEDFRSGNITACFVVDITGLVTAVARDKGEDFIGKVLFVMATVSVFLDDVWNERQCEIWCWSWWWRRSLWWWCSLNTWLDGFVVAGSGCWCWIGNSLSLAIGFNSLLHGAAIDSFSSFTQLLLPCSELISSYFLFRPDEPEWI